MSYLGSWVLFDTIFPGVHGKEKMNGETYAEVAAAAPEVPRFFSDCYELHRIGYFPSVIPGAWNISEVEEGLFR